MSDDPYAALGLRKDAGDEDIRGPTSGSRGKAIRT
jgi:hypothetical protein